MKITNEFTVHTPIDQAWKLLTDLEAIAPCMPGAALTGVEGDTYKGKVKVKVGPVISEFAGTARFTEKNDADHTAAIDAKGRDARSAGQAAAVVTAVLRPAGDDSTTVSVDTDLKITGKLAQFGSGMIKEVSTKLLAQFVTNLEAKLAAENSSPAAATSAPAPVAASSAAVETAPGTAVSPAPDSPAPVNGVASASRLGAATSSRAVASSPLGTSSGTSSGSAVSSAPAAPGASSGSSARALAAPSSSSAPVAEEPVAEEPVAELPVAGEPEPLDLLSIAGGSIYKRLVPVAVVVVVAGAVVAWLVGRR
jgi:carbon monoxide dehydrogenase subunit G